MEDIIKRLTELNLSEDCKTKLENCLGLDPDELDPPNEGERDNEDPDLPDDGGIPEYIYEEGKKELKYPEGIQYKNKMRTRGRYKHRYPQGANVHFTAGRSRRKAEGGSRARDTHLEMGEKSVEYAIKKGSYCYFVIDRDGNVHQAFSLDRWGYHSGTSYWKGLGSKIADKVVGIEIQAAGRVKPNGDGTYNAYFTVQKKGDKPFLESEVRHAPEANANIQKGTYHAYTVQQERALTELLLWLKRNNPDVFNFDYVVGHDEINPKGKNDPGAALSMTMPEFREYIKNEYSKRYNQQTIEPPQTVPGVVEADFDALVKAYKSADIKYPQLKAITIAQWMLESGRGTSKLFKEHFNAGGMKWRGTLGIDGAGPITYRAHDGQDIYAGFSTYHDFIDYYWRFLGRSYYDGWENYANDPEGFIKFIAEAGYCPSEGYAYKVIALLPEAKRLLGE